MSFFLSFCTVQTYPRTQAEVPSEGHLSAPVQRVVEDVGSIDCGDCTSDAVACSTKREIQNRCGQGQRKQRQRAVDSTQPQKGIRHDKSWIKYSLHSESALEKRCVAAAYPVERTVIRADNSWIKRREQTQPSAPLKSPPPKRGGESQVFMSSEVSTEASDCTCDVELRVPRGRGGSQDAVSGWHSVESTVAASVSSQSVSVESCVFAYSALADCVDVENELCEEDPRIDRTVSNAACFGNELSIPLKSSCVAVFSLFLFFAAERRCNTWTSQTHTCTFRGARWKNAVWLFCSC